MNASRSLLIPLSFLLLAGCGGIGQAPSPTYHYLNKEGQDQTADYRTSVRKTANEVALDLLKANPNQNFMISPWSLHECVGMIRMGASGKSEHDFAALLHSTTNARDAGKQASQLRSTIKEHLNSDVLRNVNSLWLREQFTPVPSFIDDCKWHYEAEVTSVKMPEPAITKINQHVEEVTRGKIKNLVEGLDRYAVMVLVNALSFRDKWEHPFEAGPEHGSAFVLSDGSRITVDTVGNKKDDDTEYAYAESDSAQFLRLPYKSGFQMLIVLPEVGMSPLKWLKKNPKGFPDDATFQGPRTGTILIPKWVATYKWDIQEYMKSKGWNAPFSPSSDFVGIAPEPPLYVSRAIQRTFIAVDEKGTEAAAATEMDMAAGSAPMDTGPFTFIADHPFLYIIEDPAGVPYFVGVLNDPRS